MPLAEKARQLTKTPLGFYHLTYAATYLRERRFDGRPNVGVDRSTGATGSSRRPSLRPRQRTAGALDIAHGAARRIRELYPQFEADALENFERWHFDAAFYDALVSGLEAAGLELGGQALRVRRLVPDDEACREYDHGARPVARDCLDIEHCIEVAQPLVDAPKADAAALVERIAAAPVRRQADAVVGDGNADRAVAAATLETLTCFARACWRTFVRSSRTVLKTTSLTSSSKRVWLSSRATSQPMSPWARNSSQSSSSLACSSVRVSGGHR